MLLTRRLGRSLLLFLTVLIALHGMALAEHDRYAEVRRLASELADVLIAD